MRDRRLITAHRGGHLSRDHHQKLVRWAADSVAEFIPILYEFSDDRRPEVAIQTAYSWISGTVQTGAAMKAAYACHALARETEHPLVSGIARAAGQAVATVHFADHAVVAVIYSLRVTNMLDRDASATLLKFLARLPQELAPPITDHLEIRLPQLLPASRSWRIPRQ